MQERVSRLERVVTGVDADMSALQAQRRADLDLLMALRGTQLEQGEQIAELRRDVTELRRDVTELRRDVTGLQRDVTGLRGDVTELRQGQQTIVSMLTTLIERGDSHDD